MFIHDGKGNVVEAQFYKRSGDFWASADEDVVEEFGLLRENMDDEWYFFLDLGCFIQLAGDWKNKDFTDRIYSCEKI